MSRGRRLLLLRHGQTAQNLGGIFQGHLDTDLSEVGVGQAAEAAGVLARQQPIGIWASDLKRAQQTAAPLAEATGLEVTYDTRLREINVGQWQGRRYRALHPEYTDVLTAIDRGEDVRRGGDGETVAEVAMRVRAAAEDVLDSLPDEATAVIVGHGLATRVLAADLVGLDQQVAWLTLAGISNCHWVEVVEQRTGWRITAWNAGGVGTQALLSDR